MYTTKSLFYNNHYGKLIKNVTKDTKIEFTVASVELVNMEMDGDNDNIFMATLKAGEEAFCMLKPICTLGEVRVK